MRVALVLTLAMVAVGVMSVLDFVTGREFRSVLFYLLPVLVVSWWLPRRWVLPTALIASASWTVTGFHIEGYAHIGVTLFNAVSSLLIFLMVGVLLSTVRGERDLLAAANLRVQQLLQAESQLARTDPLTRLANHREFMDRLKLDALRAARDGTSLCVLYLDLDNFKRLNDQFGHAAGDQALKEIATQLRAATRGTDLPARLGGDEFAVLLWGVDADAAAQVASRLIAGVRQLGAKWPGTALGASVGVAWFERAPQDPEQLVRTADDAMYGAKAAGKGTLMLRRVSAIEAAASPAHGAPTPPGTSASAPAENG